LKNKMKKNFFKYFFLFFLISCSKSETEEELIADFVNNVKENNDVYIEGNLSWEDAVKLALKYNKILKATIEERDIARGEKIEASSEFFPKVLSSFNYSHLDKSPSVFVNDVEIPLGKIDNYSVDLTVKQPLFYGGSIYFKNLIASLGQNIADEKIIKQIQTTIFETLQAYFDLLLAKKVYLVKKRSFFASKRHLKDVKDKIENDVASQYDLLRAKVDLSNFKGEFINADNVVKLKRSNLYKILGVSQESKIILKDSLKYKKMEMTLEKAVDIAFKNRPDLKEKKLFVDVKKEQVNIAISKFFPKFDFVYSNKWGRPDPHSSTIDSWGRQWSIALSMNWPIFEGLKKRGNLIKEKAHLEKSRYLLQDMKQQIILELRKSIFSLENADYLVKSQKLDLKRAKEALKLVQYGYKEGINTEIEVTDAISATTKSKILYYQALYQHEMAKLYLNFSLGLLNPKFISGEKR